MRAAADGSVTREPPRRGCSPAYDRIIITGTAARGLLCEGNDGVFFLRGRLRIFDYPRFCRTAS